MLGHVYNETILEQNRDSYIHCKSLISIYNSSYLLYSSSNKHSSTRMSAVYMHANLIKKSWVPTFLTFIQPFEKLDKISFTNLFHPSF